MGKSNPCEGCIYFGIAEDQIDRTEQMSARLLGEFGNSMETGALFDQNRQLAEEQGIDYDSLPTAGIRETLRGMRRQVDGLAEEVLTGEESRAKVAQGFIDNARTACRGVQKYGRIRRFKLCGMPEEKLHQFQRDMFGL